MAHNVESLAYIGAKPWHGLGVELKDGNILPADMMKAAGLDWEVGLDNVYMLDGRQVPGSKVTYRKSDGKIFDVVGDRYTVLQNAEAFEWFAPFIESGDVEFATAGSLKEGRIVFAQAKVKTPSQTIVKNDTVESYILLSHSHDGTLAVRGGFTAQRTVCSNTLAMAHNNSSSKLLKMKHTRSLNITMDKVREIMDISKAEFIATAEQYKFLANKPVNKKDIERFVTLMVNREETDDRNIKQLFEKVDWCFEHGIGMDSNTRNYWGLYNAYNEVLNYHAGRKQSNRLQSLWFGVGTELNKRALEITTKMAGNEL